MRNFLLRMLLIAAIVVPWATPMGSLHAQVVYQTGFEDATDAADWTFVNGSCTNQWYIGTGTASSGSKALYISDNGGTSASYTINSASTVYAYSAAFYMLDGEGTISFDWMCAGESCCDKGRIYLVPAADTASLRASTSSVSSDPTGAILLYGNMNGQSSWRTDEVSFTIPEPGDYCLVVMWYNDGSIGTAPALCIDNINMSYPGVTDGNICYKPSNLRVVQNYTTLSADFIWNEARDASASTMYHLVVKDAQGNVVDESTGSDTTYSLDETVVLATNTTYTVEVSTMCSADEVSQAISKTFTFLAAPYSQNFESTTSGSGSIPEGWTVVNTDSPGYPYVYNYNSHSTPNNLYFYGSENIIALPRLASNLHELQISFWAKGNTSYNEMMTVGVMTNLADTTTFRALSSYSLNDAVWRQYTVYLEASEYTNAYIVFKHTSTSSYSTAFIDDIEVSDAPDCLPVVNLSARTTATTATLSWTAIGTATSWIIDYDTTGFAMGDVHHTVVVSTNSITIENLESNKAYDFHVRALCGAGDTAEVVSLIAVRTSCPYSEAPYFENFNTATQGVLPSCWLGIALNATPAYCAQVAPNTALSSYHTFTTPYLQLNGPNTVATPIVDIPINEVELSFDLSFESATSCGPLYVGYMTEDMDAPVFFDTINVPDGYVLKSNFTNYVMFDVLDATTPGRVVFSRAGNTNYLTAIDNIKIRRIPTCKRVENPHMVSAEATSATVAWSYPLENAVSYEIAFGAQASFNIDDPSTYATTTSNDTIVELADEIIVELSNYKFAVRAICDDDTYGDWSVVASFNTLVECGEQSFRDVVSGNGTSTSYSLPAYTYNNYAYGASWTIYSEAQLQNLDIYPGQVKSFGYQAAASATSDFSFNAKVYMGTYAQATFASTSDTINRAQMTLVYNGPINMAKGEWTDVALATPFEYEGGNLVIFVERTEVVTFNTESTSDKYGYFTYTSRATGTTLYKSSATATPSRSGNQVNTRLRMCVTEPNCFNVFTAEVLDSLTTTESATLTFTEDARNVERGLTTGHTVYAVVNNATAASFDPANAQQYTGEFVSATLEGDTITIENLTPNTAYVFYVVAQCGDEMGAQYATATGRTLCAPWDLPFTANFAAAELGSTSGFDIYCWQRNSTTSTPTLVSGANAREGYALSFAVANQNQAHENAIAILPEVLSDYPINNAQISFWAKKSTAVAKSSYLMIGAMTNPADTNTFVLIDTVHIDTTIYKEYKLNLSDYDGEGQFVAIKVTNGATGHTIFVDDVTLRVKPGCEKPVDLAIENGSITANDVTLTWVNENDEVMGFQVVYKACANFLEANAVEFNTDTNTYTYSMVDASADANEGFAFANADVELIPSTIYAVAVRANCDAEHTSQWSNPVVFSTTCAPIADGALPWNDSFEGAITFSIDGYTSPADYATNTDHVLYCYDFPGKSTTRGTAPMAFVTIAESSDSNSSLAMVATNNNPVVVVLPEFDNEIAAMQLSFDYMSYTASNGSIEVGFYANDAFTALETLPMSGSWVRFDHLYSTDTVEFPENARMAIRYSNSSTSVSNSAASYIDNITINRAATCAKPLEFAINSTIGVSAYAIPLKWKNGPVGDANAWDIEYTYTNENNQTVTNVVNVEGLTPSEAGVYTYLLNGLLSNTNYAIRLRSNCGAENGLSDWSNTVINTTTKKDLTYIATFRAYVAAQQIGNAVIDSVNHTVNMTVVYGTPIDSMRAYLTVSPGATAKVNNINWSNYNYYNFTNGLNVVVYSEDVTLSQAWTIYVNAEPCATPTSLTFSNVLRREFTANWVNPDETANVHELLISQTALTEAELETLQPIVVTGENSYTFTDVDRATEYHVYLRANCGQTTSRWISSTVTTKSLAACDELTIADGTATNGYLPVYGYYCDAVQREQMIYPASMLTDYVGKEFTAMKFYVASGSNANWADGVFEVRIGEVATENFSASTAYITTGTTLVHNGTLPMANNVMTVTFDQPYLYQGGNLLLDFWLPESIGWTTCSFYGVTAPNAGMYKSSYSEGSTGITQSFLPKVSFTYCYDTPACPDVRDLAIEYDMENPTQVTLHWQADGDYAYEYDFYVTEDEMSVDQLNAGVEAGTAMNIVDANQYRVTGLNPYTWYNFYIRVQCNENGMEDGMSGWSMIPFRTNSACRTPENLAVSYNSKTSATITWSADAVQAANYQYIISTTAIPNTDGYAPNGQGLETESVTLNNLTPGEHYYFYIANACGADGVSPYELLEFDMVPACPAPVAVNFTDVAPTGARVSWQRDSINFADETSWQVRYYVYGDESTANTVVVNDVPSIVITRLFDNATYVFEISAICDATAGEPTVAYLNTPVQSDCVTIGNGSDYNQYNPSYSCYNYSYTQQIYTAAQLGSAGNITGVSFNVTSGVTGDFKFNVYVANTNKNSFADASDYVPVAQLTPVASNVTLSRSAGWKEIEFSTPFAYTGGNLVVAVQDVYGEYDCTANFASDNVGNNQSLYFYQDGGIIDPSAPSALNSGVQSMLPQAKFCFQSTGCHRISNLVVDNIEGNSAKASWYSGSQEPSWDYVLSTVALSEAELASAEAISTEDNNLNLDNLLGDADYYLYVRPVCGADSYGDWTSVNFRTLPSCSAPSVVATMVDNTVVTLMVAHDGGYGEADNFEYQIIGVTDTNFSYTFVGGDSVVYTELAYMSDYTWRVRSICGEGDTSRWTNGYQFHICGSVNIPFAENFVTYGTNKSASATCWNTLSNIANGYYPSLSNGYMYFNNSSSYTEEFAVSPMLEVNANQLMVSFDAYAFGANNLITVGVMTDPNDANTFQEAATIELTSTRANYEVALADYNVDGNYVAFRTTYEAEGGIYLYSANFDYVPSCRRPQHFMMATAQENAHSVNLKWEQPNTVVAWMLFDTISGQTFQIPFALADVEGTQVNFSLAPLSANTDYVFGIYAVCDNGTSDTAVNFVAVHTLADEAQLANVNMGSLQVGSAAIDNANHIATVTLRADADITNLTPRYTYTSGARLMDAMGDAIVYGDAYDFTYGQYVYLQPAGKDVEPTEWEIRTQIEGCATVYDLAVRNYERTWVNLAWNVADTNVSEFQFIMSNTAISNRDLASHDYETITVNGQGQSRIFHIDGLDRETRYYFYVRNTCGGSWLSTNVTTEALNFCVDADAGNGTSTYSGAPVYTSYGNSYSQQLIRASELVAAGLQPGKEVTSIYYYFTGVAGFSKALTLAIGNTSRESFSSSSDFQDWNTLTVHATNVPRNVNAPLGWFEIPLTTPFVWDGVSNIIVATISNQNGSTQTTSTGFSANGVATSYYSTVVRYQDNNPISLTNPTATYSTYSLGHANIRFHYCVDVDACPVVENVVAEPTTESVDLTWDASNGDYAASYQVVLSDTAVVDFSTIDSLETYNYAGVETACSFNGLTENTEYYAYVRVICNANGHEEGASVWAEMPFRTFANCRFVTDLAAEVTGKTTATVSWNFAEDMEGNFAYILSTEAMTEDQLAEVTEDDYEDMISETMVDLEDLTPGETYYMYITNVCGDELRSEWRGVEFTTIPSCVAPINVTVDNVTGLGATLAWESGEYGDEASWQITWVYGDAEDSVSNAQTMVAERQIAIIPFTANGVTYRAYVRAICEDGMSEATMISIDVPVAISGDCVYSGTGASITSGAPIYTGWGNSYSQTIYTAEQLSELGFHPGPIYAISYRWNQAGSYDKEVSIYMATTDMSQFAGATASDCVPASDFTLVYGPTPRMAADADSGWVQYDFTEPYLWDGQSNLVVGLLVNQFGGSQTGGNANCYSTQRTGTYPTIYKYQDSNPLDPATVTAAGFSNRSAYQGNIQLCVGSTSDCARTSRLVVSDVTSTEAHVEWYPTSVSESGYLYVLSHEELQGDALVDAMLNGAFVTGITVDLTELDIDADYYFYVAPSCGAGDATMIRGTYFRTVPTCVEPVAAIATVRDGDGIVSLTVVAAEGTEPFSYEYKIWGEGLEDTIFISGTNDEVIDMAELTPFVTYNWKVQAICDEEGENASRWIEGNTFTTCSAASIPFFSSADADISCWRIAYQTGQQAWSVGTTTNAPEPRSGRYFFFSHGTTGNSTFLLTPEFDLTNNDETLALSFWHAQRRWGSDTNELHVYYQDNPDSNWHLLQSYTEDIQDWQFEVVALPGSDTASYYRIAFLAVDNFGYPVVLDDIKVGVPEYFNVNVAINDTNWGYVEGAGSYMEGSNVVLTAVPTVGNHFVQWGDEVMSATRTVTVNADINLEAFFEPDMYNVTIVSNDTTLGTVTSSATTQVGYGAEVDITATANEHCNFVMWSDSVIDAERTITIEGNTRLVAIFAKDSFNVVAETNIEGLEVFGAGMYAYGDTAMLIAPDQYGATFSTWSNGATTDTLVFAVYEDAEYVATYVPTQFTLTVGVEGNGTVTGAGTYAYMTEVELVAVPAEGSYFNGWSDGEINATRTWLIWQDDSLTANFVDSARYAINVVSNNDDFGMTTGTGIYTEGDTVTIAATPAFGYHFVAWNDGDTNAVRNFAATEDADYTATFAINNYTINIVSLTTLGTVAIDNVEGNTVTVEHGTEVTIRAIANTGRKFLGWNNGAIMDTVYTFVATENRDFVANFGNEQYVISLYVNSSRGTVYGDTVMDYQSRYTISTEPKYGYHFVMWSDSNTNMTRTGILTEDIYLDAIYAPDTFEVTIVSADLGMGYVSESARVAYNHPFSFRANANYGYQFKNWSDNDTSISRNVVITRDTMFTANFEAANYRIVAMSANNSMGTVAGTGNYAYLTNATLVATPRAGFEFVMWTDSVLDATRTVQVTGEATYTAMFRVAEQQYTVTLATNDETMGTVTGAGTYNANAYANIQATAEPLYRFARWSDNSTEAIRRIRVTSDTMLTALFVPDTHTLFVVAAQGTRGTVTGGGQYLDSAQVTVTATPNYGYKFKQWRCGSITDTNASWTFTFDHARHINILADFDPLKYNVTVAMADTTLGRVTGTGLYNFGSTQTIQAIDTVANDGYVFARWNDGNTDNPRTITVDGPVTYTAIFVDANEYFTVAANVNNAERGYVEVIDSTHRGTSVSVDSIVLGTQVTLRAFANEGFEFTKWSDDNTNAVRVVTIGSDTVFTAIFDTTSYNVTVVANARQGSVEGAGSYIAGREATLTAVAADHYHFTKWSDNITVNPRTITVESDTTFTALFAIDTFTVTAVVSDPTMGSVAGLKASGRYTYGEYFGVTANANYGYEFDSWNDGTTTNRYQGMVTGDMNLVATFTTTQFTINAIADDEFHGEVAGSGAYNYGENATLTAVNNYGYHFTGWLGNNGAALGNANPLTVVVNGPNSYIATFEPDTFNVVATSVDTVMGSVEVSANAAAYLSTIVMEAVPANGYVFAGWNDGVMSNPRQFSIERDTMFTAMFTADMFELTVLSTDTTMGTVTGAGTYAFGTVQTIAATPVDAEQYSFYFWNDGDTNAVREITINGDATYTATFGLKAYRVSVAADHGTVEQTNNGMLLYGEMDTINVIADYGYVFAGWNDGNIDNPRIVEVLGNISMTANFVKDSFNVALACDSLGTVAGAGRYEFEGEAVLTATAINNYHFVAWNDGNTENPRTITVMGDTTFTATFEINTHVVTLNVNDAERGTVRGAGSYDYGFMATLTATPAYGYEFTSWSNGITINPYVLEVTSDTTLTAIFNKAHFDVAVSCNTTMGTVTGAGNYEYLDTIAISATANYGYHFVAWNDGNTANPRNVEVTGDAAYTATFAANTYVMTLVADTTMGTVTGAGNYEYLATANIAATAKTGYHFMNWSDGDTNATRQIVMTNDSTLTAVFAPNMYTITVEANNAEFGTVTGGGIYAYGTEVTLTATATATNHFANWNDGNADNPRTIVVTGDKLYRAVFVHDQQTYTVTLNVNDNVMGHVEGAGSYVEGQTAHIKAIANNHYEFENWSDGNTDAERDIVVNGNITLTANFVAMNYMITVTANDATMGTVTGTGSYAYNTTATITATANTGYRFVAWNDGNTDATRTVTVTGDAEYVATFEALQGIDDVNAENVVVYTTENNIVVKGAANQSIYIYDAVGRCVSRVANNVSEVNEFTMPTSGVYMVKVGNLPARRVVVVR